MKIYLTIGLILISFSGIGQETLATKPTINKVFNKSEIHDLQIILDFFNNQICLQQKTVNRKTSEYYSCFFDRMLNDAQKGILDVKIPFEKQKKMYQQINHSTFNQIWTFAKSWTRNSLDTLKYLQYRIKGKYIKFLKKLSKNNEFVKSYYKSYKASGDISPGMVINVLENYKNDAINDVRIQLIVAIHYLTLNDQQLRKEKYKKSGN